MKKTIVIALGDVGSLQYILAVLVLLQGRYHVRLVADKSGAAIVRLKEAGIPHEPWNGEAVDLSGVSAVLCGTAGKVQRPWRFFTETARSAGVKVIWFGDGDGSGNEPPFRDLSPNYMMTFDELTREHFLRLRSSFVSDRIRAVGNPALDKNTTKNPWSVRNKMRAQLRLARDDIFVVYPVSSLLQFEVMESLRILIPWAKQNLVLLSVRFHPANLTDSAAVRLAGHREYLKKALSSKLLATSHLPWEQVWPAANLIVTDYSTAGSNVALVGGRAACLIGPSAEKYLTEKRGMSRPFFSVLQSQERSPAPAVGIFEEDDAPTLLNEALNISLAEIARRLEHPRFRILRDGKAGERVVQFIREVVD